MDSVSKTNPVKSSRYLSTYVASVLWIAVRFQIWTDFQSLSILFIQN